MPVRELSLPELRARLQGPGLGVKAGPFAFSIRNPGGALARPLGDLYADFPVAPEDGFSDFHVRVRQSGGLRRLLRPQCLFDLDGEIPFRPLPGRQAFALLEWGMNWCIHAHAHQFLVLHGAVLERAGGGLLLPAPPGSGKSTLCAALMCQGWRLLSDELVLIDPKTGELHGMARPISLKNRSIDLLRRRTPEAFITAPVHDTAKGAVAHMRPSTASVQRVLEPVQPRWVVFPRYQPDAGLEVTSLRRLEVFRGLLENAFNYSLLGATGFRVMADLVERVAGCSVRYGDLDAVIAHIEAMAAGEG